jgi:hypothetical protein
LSPEGSAFALDTSETIPSPSHTNRILTLNQGDSLFAPPRFDFFLAAKRYAHIHLGYEYNTAV